MSDPLRPARRGARSRGARVVVLAVGYALLGVGLVLLVLPGPGSVVILAALAVVGREQHWARHLEGRIRRGAARLAGRVLP